MYPDDEAFEYYNFEDGPNYPAVPLDVEVDPNKNLRTATVRTALPVGWVAAATYVATKLGLNLDEVPEEVLVVAVPVVVGIAYRAFREIESRFPVIGRILFGSSAAPAAYAPAGEIKLP